MTQADAIKWIADLFEEPVDHITPEAKRDDIPGWDSLGILNLMAGLDEGFGILLSEAEISKLQRVEDVLNILKQHGKLS
jgi:acyl carrier protein